MRVYTVREREKKKKNVAGRFGRVTTAESYRVEFKFIAVQITIVDKTESIQYVYIHIYTYSR